MIYDDDWWQKWNDLGVGRTLGGRGKSGGGGDFDKVAVMWCKALRWTYLLCAMNIAWLIVLHARTYSKWENIMWEQCVKSGSKWGVWTFRHVRYKWDAPTWEMCVMSSESIWYQVVKGREIGKVIGYTHREVEFDILSKKGTTWGGKSCWQGLIENCSQMLSRWW